MPRFIEATDAIRVLSEYYNYRTDVENCRLALAISNVPTADVVEMKHGRWIGGEIGYCSCCGHKGCASDIWDFCKDGEYCPNCGAKMEDDNG